MMLKTISAIIFLICGSFLIQESEVSFSDNALDMRSVYEVEQLLGGVDSKHLLNSTMPGVSAEKGKELFLTGYTTKPNGQRTKKQSKHYVCTSCHNIVKEDPDLGNPNPEDRLDYARDQGIPFLQGTSLYGVVNRKTFYNGDYKHKYGPETVNKVKEDLRESIQLCAVGCAQGRSLDNWEKESILAYFWTLQLQMSDLRFTHEEENKITKALDGGKKSPELVRIIQNKYSQFAPATFGETPENWKEGYPFEGNAERGEMIFSLSCMHCHENGRYSYYSMDKNDIDLNHLAKHFDSKTSSYSSYRLITKGTLPVYGDKAYMPQYPLERMSKQQIEDLRAYVEN